MLPSHSLASWLPVRPAIRARGPSTSGSCAAPHHVSQSLFLLRPIPRPVGGLRRLSIPRGTSSSSFSPPGRSVRAAPASHTAATAPNESWARPKADGPSLASLARSLAVSRPDRLCGHTGFAPPARLPVNSQCLTGLTSYHARAKRSTRGRGPAPKVSLPLRACRVALLARRKASAPARPALALHSLDTRIQDCAGRAAPAKPTPPHGQAFIP